MDINDLPKYDMSDNPTKCCPRFKPDGWDEQELHFRKKLFLRAHTRSIFHIPINMGSVFPKTLAAIEKAGAMSKEQFIVLSHEVSAWSAEHYFAITKEIPFHEMVDMTGDYLTRVFEGPYKDAPKWEKDMAAFVASKGKKLRKTYFFYTTCPKCAQYYGKNYVVVVAEIQ